MSYQLTFRRYEVKYLLTHQDKALLLETMQPYMHPDAYGRTVIRNIYYDTTNYLLIRNSLEKPMYKEKLRLRGYQTVRPRDPVFVELKKKYDSVVYKRRMVLPEEEAVACLQTGRHLPEGAQIAAEIDAFRAFYRELVPVVFLSYEREAFCPLDGSDFRITFDENILFRDFDFSLEKEAYGQPLLGPTQTLLEIKTPGGMPLWMTRTLSALKIYPVSFSKYGSAYQKMWKEKLSGGYCYV